MLFAIQDFVQTNVSLLAVGLASASAAFFLALILTGGRSKAMRGNLDGDLVPEGSFGQKALLSPWERRVMPILLAQLPTGLHLCPQVRLLDLLQAGGVDARQNRILRNRVSSKSLDFVVIDGTGRPYLVLELNDSSHNQPDRKLRDALVAEVLRQAGIPLAVLRPGQVVELHRWLPTQEETLTGAHARQTASATSTRRRSSRQG